MNGPQSADFEIVAGTGRKGVGLFATRAFARGDALFLFDYWSRPEMPIHSTNHSCDPNASFGPDGMLRALRAIGAHEEVTFDYLIQPIPASPWNFECACGAETCRGWIDAARDAGGPRG